MFGEIKPQCWFLSVRERHSSLSVREPVAEWEKKGDPFLLVLSLAESPALKTI